MLKIHIDETPLKAFNKLDNVDEIKISTYVFKEELNVGNVMKIVHRHMELRFAKGKFDRAKYIVLGSKIYESLLANNYRVHGEMVGDKFMDMEIILDFRDKYNIELKDSAMEEFVEMIKYNNKEKMKNENRS